MDTSHIGKGNLTSLVDMIVNHHSIPNNDICYSISRMGTLALALNDINKDYRLDKTNYESLLNITEAIDDRTKFVFCNSRNKSEWMKTLSPDHDFYRSKNASFNWL